MFTPEKLDEMEKLVAEAVQHAHSLYHGGKSGDGFIEIMHTSHLNHDGTHTRNFAVRVVTEFHTRNDFTSFDEAYEFVKAYHAKTMALTKEEVDNDDAFTRIGRDMIRLEKIVSKKHGSVINVDLDDEFNYIVLYVDGHKNVIKSGEDIDAYIALGVVTKK